MKNVSRRRNNLGKHENSVFELFLRNGSVVINYVVAASGFPITTSEIESTIENSLDNSCQFNNDSSGTTFQLAENCTRGK